MGLFRPANREQLKLRMALDGPSGSGKSLTALRFAFALAGPTGRVAAIDTEHRSLSKYQGDEFDGCRFDFDVAELTYFSPDNYTRTIQAAAGYDVLIIDSLSHAWDGLGGALEQVDNKGGNRFTGWKDVTPLHRQMVEAILASPMHVIATMRSKMEYVLEPDHRGKMVPRKVGMAPVQRAGMEYEFDLVCDLDTTHQLAVSKTRCPAVDGQSAIKPGAMFLQPVIEWLDHGTRPQSSTEEFHQMNLSAQAVPATATSVATNGPATEQQREMIIDYARAVGMPPEKLTEAVARRLRPDGQPCRQICEMTFDQARELIQKLQSIKAEKDGVPF